MHNKALSEIFEQIALLLELQDDNPFRVRAYRRAALTMDNLPEDVSTIHERGELEKIPGIGHDLKAKIEEFLQTGKVCFLEAQQKKVPKPLLEMVRIPGVGPKTAKQMYDALKPKNLTDLERKILRGKLKGLPKIKEKTEQNILSGLELLKKHHGRMPLGKALPLARDLVNRLKKFKNVLQIDYAGSTRRMCETIRDLDILIAAKKPQPIMDAFVKMEDVLNINAHGKTKSSVVLKSGLQVDLRIVNPESYGAAFCYFTGSKAHNIQLRSLAKKKGWKINEYGIFQIRGNKKIAGRHEKDIYKKLGIAYVPPEMREDTGEIQITTQKKRLPKLVEEKDILGDFHLHSKWSDGVNEIEDMIQSGKKRGLKYLVLTDHSQSLHIAHGLSPQRIRKQITLVRKLNKKARGITVLIGSEVDILKDGSLDYKDSILKELDFVVASVHSYFKLPKKEMTQRIIKAMQNKYVNVIGHPTGRLIGERAAYEIDLEQICQAAKDTNTALEINSQPWRLDLNDQMARRARELGVTLAINTDSHEKNQFTNLEYGVAVASP